MINKVKKFWFKIPDKIRFLLIGGFNTTISYLIFLVICLIIGEQRYQLALVSAWILSSIVSFTTHRCLVFPVKGNLFKQYCKCCTTWIFSYLINAILLEILVQKVQMSVYSSQILATFACAIFTYILFKTFAFRRNYDI